MLQLFCITPSRCHTHVPSWVLIKENDCPSLLHRRERRVYYLHRYKARRYPNKYLTIIDDAMDQKTTCIPCLCRKTKATCNLSTVGTHLVGAIFHSGQSPNGKEVFGSFDYYQWPHDPNLTGSVLCTYWLSRRAGRENIWPEVMAYGPSAARSVRHDRGPNIFPSGPT